jgi:phosphatidylserine/phosphatidylglycerophosphate/cardiolipin synthase-like enzyme
MNPGKRAYIAAASIAGASLAVGAAPIAFTPGSPIASVEIHYSPEEDLEAIDVALIGEAARTIDIDAYVLTDESVVAALIAAGKRGVRVRVWRESSEPEANSAAELGERYKKPGELMHLKSYCVDDSILRSGSANFSRSGLTRQDNDLIILRQAGACDSFEAKFAKAWGG